MWGAAVLWIQDGKPDSFGDLTKCLVGTGKSVHETEPEELRRYRKLNGVERAQAVVRPLGVDEPLCVPKMPSGYGDGSQYFAAQIAAEARTEEFDVSDGQLTCRHFSREGGRDFDNGEPGDVQGCLSLFEERLNCWCSRLSVIEFPDRTGIEEVPRQSEALLAFGCESRSHSPGNLCQCRSHFFQCHFRQFLACKAC